MNDELERIRSWPNFKALSRHSRGGTKENHEEPQDSQSPGQDLTPRPPEYKAGVVSTRIRRSVRYSWKWNNLSWSSLLTLRQTKYLQMCRIISQDVTILFMMLKINLNLPKVADFVIKLNTQQNSFYIAVEVLGLAPCIFAGRCRRFGEKTCPSSILSNTNLTWIDPGANSGLRGERPATNRLSHGTAQVAPCSLIEIDPSSAVDKNE
jgi:hypothetical protein